jgi:hypothetical protein
MLDPSQPVSDVSGLTVYRDDHRPERYYTFPSVPRLALDSNGAPAISLLLYGKKTGGVFKVNGGYLNLTTSLALSDEEAGRLRVILQERVRRAMNLAPDAPVEIELVAPAWTSGTVTVHLGEGLELYGAPSLLGANEAALSLSLDTDKACQLQLLWKNGLPDASISYKMQTEAAQKEHFSSTSSVSVSSAATQSTSVNSVQNNFDASLTQAIPFSVQAQGRLGISAAELSGHIDEIGL